MRWLRIVSVCASAALLYGCGDGERKYSVSGTVTFTDGTPVHGGTLVYFDLADGLVGGYAMVIGHEGRFEGINFEAVNDGLPAGIYNVFVRPPPLDGVLPEVAATAPPNFGIQNKYMRADTSGFQLTVQGPVTDYGLVLDPMPGLKARR